MTKFAYNQRLLFPQFPFMDREKAFTLDAFRLKLSPIQ